MSWRQTLISLARRCYFATPSPAVRRIAFAAFARAVRNSRTVALIDGLRFDLDLAETIDLAVLLGRYEPEVTEALRRYTERGATVFDIGANVGAHTLLLATLVGPEGRVAAFEPTDYAFEKLKRNLALNELPQVEAVKIALSDRQTDVQSMNFRSSWMTNGGRKDGASSVRFETLDAWCADHGVEGVDLIKLDVDGNEFPLFTGAWQTISRCRPVFVMEAVGLHFDDETRNPYRLLADIGYRFRELKSGSEMTVEAMRDRLPRNDAAMTVGLNVLAMPSEVRETKGPVERPALRKKQ